MDRAVAEGRRYGRSLSPAQRRARLGEWRPSEHLGAPAAGDFADFASAAARRYPGVRHWMIWGEPSKASRFQPLVQAMGRRLSPAQLRGPRHYAPILDASYAVLKRVNRHNLVIGGNTWTGGEVLPLNFIRTMRLPSGRRPRMDLYGHNPFGIRTPDLRESPVRFGYADFSTDHSTYEFNFWVTRRTQAKWLAAALRIARRWNRIYTLGYLRLYDDPPRPDGLEVNRGLLTRTGIRKPAFYTFQKDGITKRNVG